MRDRAGGFPVRRRWLLELWSGSPCFPCRGAGRASPARLRMSACVTILGWPGDGKGRRHASAHFTLKDVCRGPPTDFNWLRSHAVDVRTRAHRTGSAGLDRGSALRDAKRVFAARLKPRPTYGKVWFSRKVNGAHAALTAKAAPSVRQNVVLAKVTGAHAALTAKAAPSVRQNVVLAKVTG